MKKTATKRVTKTTTGHVICVGCDLHDKSMLLMIGVDDRPPVRKTWGTDREARQKMIADLQRRAAELTSGSATKACDTASNGVKTDGTRIAPETAAGNSAFPGVRIVFAYEASGLGWSLHDAVTAAGIEGHVLAPTGIERSLKHARRKTDERDAQRLLELLRAHVFAGTSLPSVWIPDVATRDDREVVRARLDMVKQVVRTKSRIRCLLKRHDLAVEFGGWTNDGRTYLDELVKWRLGFGAASALASLIRKLDFVTAEMDRLDEKLKELAAQPRHAEVIRRVPKIPGVGELTLLTFLVEMGPMSRFANRRQVGSYLGLTPGSQESGQCDDRKGHITRQGPARVRKMLCQAVWVSIQRDAAMKKTYEALISRNANRKRVAVVAFMRKLAIRLWHEIDNAQAAAAEVLRATPQHANPQPPRQQPPPPSPLGPPSIPAAAPQTSVTSKRRRTPRKRQQITPLDPPLGVAKSPRHAVTTPAPWRDDPPNTSSPSSDVPSPPNAATPRSHRTARQKLEDFFQSQSI
jgi:transposase